MADDPVGDGGKLMSAHGLDLTSGAVIRCGHKRFSVFFLFPVSSPKSEFIEEVNGRAF